MPEDTKKREEYAPITQRLREHLKVAALMQGYELSTPLAKGVLTECDNIDAIHKALEDENASLREQNAKLRETVAEHARSNVEAVTFLDRLSDAVEKREDLTLWDVDYVAYPVGCDMRTIRPMCKVDGYGRTHTVMQLILNNDGSWSLVNARGDTFYDMAAFAHHQDDVKDKLLEMIGELMSTPMNKLRADKLAEKYAKNFTLAEDCEDGNDDE